MLGVFSYFYFSWIECGDWRCISGKSTKAADHFQCGLQLPSHHRGPGSHHARHLHSSPDQGSPTEGRTTFYFTLILFCSLTAHHLLALFREAWSVCLIHWFTNNGLVHVFIMDVSVQNGVKQIVFTKALYSVSLDVFCLFFFLLSLIKLLSPSVFIFCSLYCDFLV